MGQKICTKYRTELYKLNKLNMINPYIFFNDCEGRGHVTSVFLKSCPWACVIFSFYLFFISVTAAVSHEDWWVHWFVRVKRLTAAVSPLNIKASSEVSYESIQCREQARTDKSTGTWLLMKTAKLTCQPGNMIQLQSWKSQGVSSLEQEQAVKGSKE